MLVHLPSNRRLTISIRSSNTETFGLNLWTSDAQIDGHSGEPEEGSQLGDEDLGGLPWTSKAPKARAQFGVPALMMLRPKYLPTFPPIPFPSVSAIESPTRSTFVASEDEAGWWAATGCDGK